MDRISSNVEAAARLSVEDFYGDEPDRPSDAELAAEARWSQTSSPVRNIPVSIHEFAPGYKAS